MARPRYTIGALARQAGCGVETVRYYERIGLLPRPARTAGGQRVYGPDDLRRLSLIREMRSLDFPLAEVRRVLGMLESGDYGCRDIRNLAKRHQAQLRARIAALTRLEAEINDLARRCDGGRERDCPIVHTLLDAPSAAGESDTSPRARSGAQPARR